MILNMKYVEHPRYGTTPNFTGLDPDPDDYEVNLHYNTNFYTKKQRAEMLKYSGWLAEPNKEERHIPGTAIMADLSRQTHATVPVTHYYDIEKVCQNCRRLFVFYALEQKHWYEGLGFSLDADCIRCVPCRKKEQDIQRLRKRYNELVNKIECSDEEEFELARTRLTLMENGIFSPSHSPKVREFFNKFPEHPKIQQLRSRLQVIETPHGIN